MLNFEEEKARYVFKLKLDVRWGDMDEMGHVNNAIYLTYFEQARIYYFEAACKWNWKEQGAILASAHVDYIRPILFPNVTYVHVRTSKIGNKSLEINYLITTIVNGIEHLATTGYTVMVMFDYKNNTSIPVPDFIREFIRSYEVEKI